MKVQIIFLSLLGCFTLTSCDSKDKHIPTPPPTKPPHAAYIGEADMRHSLYTRQKKPLSKNALQQSEDEKDRLLTQNIRKALLGDKNLSLRAKNITIITEDGIVTLRGIVATPLEKEHIADKVSQISGVTHLNNKLEVSDI